MTAADAAPAPRKRDLRERLDDGGVLCAEGFLFEMERRGYLACGMFVPEVALENPEALRSLHVDFQHAGSDVVEAFTYYGHRAKMRALGKEDLLEPLNRGALRIAREVAAAVPAGCEPNLVAGNLSNTNVWEADDKGSRREARAMFDEMVGWAADEGVDYIVAETFYFAGEALAALESIRSAGIEAVVTLAPVLGDRMSDGAGIADTCKELEQGGAAAVGMNCFRGPETMMPHVRAIRAAVGCHVAALPVTFRTTAGHPTFLDLPDNNGCRRPAPRGRPYPTGLDPLRTNRHEIRAFAEEAWALGVRYLGVCCGGSPADVREVAEAMGRTPAASRFRADLSDLFRFAAPGAAPAGRAVSGRPL